MAVNEKNFSYFKYVDDNGTGWNVRGEDGGPGSAIDGHATDYTLPAFGRQSRRRHVRYAVWTDPATFRSVRTVIYTAAAFAAIASGATVDVSVAGGATTVPYTLSAKVGERLPIAAASRHLAE